MRVLVIGATGQQGGAVARELLAHGHAVRGLSRDIGSPRALRLREQGAEVVAGNLEDPQAIKAAADGVDAVFALSTPYEEGVAAEVRQGMTLARATANQGLHLIYSSGAGADRDTGIGHLEGKRQVELELARLDRTATILRPVAFMENAGARWARAGLARGVLALPYPSGRKVQHIALADVAVFARLVLERPADFTGMTIELASEELTGDQMADGISAASGHAIRFVEPDDAALATDFGPDGRPMYDWFGRAGFEVDIAALRAAYPQVPWRDFTTWAQQQDWSFLDHA